MILKRDLVFRTYLTLPYLFSVREVLLSTLSMSTDRSRTSYDPIIRYLPTPTPTSDTRRYIPAYKFMFLNTAAIRYCSDTIPSAKYIASDHYLRSIIIKPQVCTPYLNFEFSFA